MDGSPLLNLNVLREFTRLLASRRLFGKEDRLLLAISGGIDSVVLCHLLVSCGYKVALAHCNFKLRGTDSDKDELFCEELARNLGLVFYAKHLPLTTRGKKMSVQEEARVLRYDWFEKLRKKEGYDYLLTAHHADDQAETLLLNLIRGTGLRGLRGIAEKDQYVVRPLLSFTRTEIASFAKENGIRFTNDRSNKSGKYRRNFIRLKIIPLLKKLNPSIISTLSENARRFSGEFTMLQCALEDQAAAFGGKEGYRKIGIKDLLASPAPEALLFYLLSQYGFQSKQTDQVLASVISGKGSGKSFTSPGYEITIDRAAIIIRPKTGAFSESASIQSLQRLKRSKLFSVERYRGEKTGPADLIVDEKKLMWPLTLRFPRKGDRFRPFGMKGSKLLSDYFREQKLNAFEKERTRVLENGNGEIIWIPGWRSDERYKVKGTEEKIIKLTYLEQA